MPVLHRATQRTEAILRQMLDLLEELSLEYGQHQEEDEDEEGGHLSSAHERDLLLTLTEEAAERGMDEENIEKILRSILHMAKEGHEG